MRRGAHLEEMHWRLDFDASGTVTGASHESAAMEGRLDAARGKLVLVERRAHAASWASPVRRHKPSNHPNTRAERLLLFSFGLILIGVLVGQKGRVGGLSLKAVLL